MAGIEMDGPIFFYEIHREMNAEAIEPDDEYIEQIEKALLLENKHDFVKLINNLPSDLLDDELNSIKKMVFWCNSSKCAAAILDGETKLTKMPPATAWPAEADSSPLHYAADSSACKVTAVLLERGFSANVRADYWRFKAVLPIDVIMSKLRTRANELRNLNAANVVTELCLHETRVQLETLRLLAENTRDVKRMFFNYLKEGKIVEVVALLLVARSRLLSSSTATAEGEFRSISEMYDFVLNVKRQLSPRLHDLAEIEELLVVLQIFDRVGDKLATLVRLDFSPAGLSISSNVPQLVQSLIQDAGFYVNPKYIYYKKSPSSSARETAKGFESYVSRTGIDEFIKTFVTTDAIPTWAKEATFRGLGDKISDTSRLTYPLLSEPLPVRNSVAVPPLTSRAAVPKLENITPLHRIMKKTAPVLGTMKRILRPA